MSKRIWFKTIQRDSLFFDRYEWCVSWFQPGIHVLRSSLEQTAVDNQILLARHWEFRNWSRKGPHETAFESRLNADVVQHIHDTRILLLSLDGNKRVLHHDRISVYVNDFISKNQVLEYAKKFDLITVRQALAAYPKDCVGLLDPAYKFRTYLKSVELTSNIKKAIANWISVQGADIKASPSLIDTLNYQPLVHIRGFRQTSNWTQRHNFIDHNDEKYVTMLNLLVPGISRKTIRIVAK